MAFCGSERERESGDIDEERIWDLKKNQKLE